MTTLVWFRRDLRTADPACPAGGLILRQVRQDFRGDRAVAAVEMMAAGHFDHRAVLAGGLRARRLSVGLAIETQVRRTAPPGEFRCGRYAAMRSAEPVREMKFEIRAVAQPKQRGQSDERARLRWQPIDHERQGVGALRIADHERPAPTPDFRVVAQYAVEVARRTVRRARGPEILQ